MFECQCAIFIVDITSNESFNLIKNLIENIEKRNTENENKINYLKKILLINKIDLESERQVSKEEITSIITEIPTLELIEISLKEFKDISELENKIIQSYGKNNQNNFATDLIYEEEEEKSNLHNSLYMKADTTINCIIIGETEVGKSCFLMRYYRNLFSESFLTTVGIDKETKLIKIKDTLYRLSLWDTAGQERFRCLPIKYYQNADGILLLFDVSSRKSFDAVNIWVQDVDKNAKSNSRKNLFLIGNKIDLKRQVSKEEAIKKAKELGMEYFEVSVKTNMNISEVMAKMIYNCYQIVQKSENEKLDNKKAQKKKKKFC